MQPEFPIYIISKGRWESRLTAKALQAIDVPFRMVIEEQEFPHYAAVIDPQRLIILDPQYQRDYDACCELQPGQSKGSGPARNFVWDHSIAAGAAHHWLMDDNISFFGRMADHRRRIRVADGTIFRCMENFVQRYKNVALSGPNYHSFATQPLTASNLPPFTHNTRIFSCILIRNDIPFRWRCRYNEDADLSLRVLKAGYCTIQFNAFMQNKMATQTMRGGNTDEIYKDGTLAKSRMLARLHPDVARLSWKFGRWHHHVDYRGFKRDNKLIVQPGVTIGEGVNNYGMQLRQLEAAA